MQNSLVSLEIMSPFLCIWSCNQSGKEASSCQLTGLETLPSLKAQTEPTEQQSASKYSFLLSDAAANVLESWLYLVIQAIKACLDTKPEVKQKANCSSTHHPTACLFYPALSNIQANYTWILSNWNTCSSSAKMIWQCKTPLLNNISQQSSYTLLYFMLLHFASTSLDHPKGFFSLMFFKYLWIIISPT